MDLLIVILSIAGIVMEKMKSGQVLPINPTLIRVMRVLRIARGRSNVFIDLFFEPFEFGF